MQVTGRLIDLHTHTTASDGSLEPSDLLRFAWQAGLRVVSVTDHDTVAALHDAAGAAAACGIAFLRGIEITAISSARDIHVLGYGIDETPSLTGFLRAQQRSRIARIEASAARLALLGRPVSIAPLVEAAQRPGASIGRPALARLMVAAGHVTDVRQAFDLWLGEARPAYVPREGAPVAEVIRIIHDAGGVASLAHPGVYGRDGDIGLWVREGLDAIEVYHREHDPATVERYLDTASRHGLLVTGGSDYHGEERRDACPLGSVTLPEAHYARVATACARAARLHGRGAAGG